MQFTNILFIATLFALKVNADLIAWSGDTCNEQQGSDVPCNGGCFGFETRHSFKITGADGHNVILFEGAKCTGQQFNFGFQTPGNCINVNTGTSVVSGRCV